MATMEARVPTAEKAPAPLVPQGVEAPHDVVKEKSVISPHPVPTPLEKLDVSKAPPSPPLADSTSTLSLSLTWKYTHAHLDRSNIKTSSKLVTNKQEKKNSLVFQNVSLFSSNSINLISYRIA